VRPWLAATSLIAFATAVAFSNTLSFGFVWDDHFLIGGSHFVRSWSTLPQILTSHFWAGHADWKMYYRPLINVTFLVDYQIWGLNALGYHLTNVLVHLAASLAVVGIGATLLQDRLAGLVAGLVFTLHPVHSQSVSFIAGRTDLVATLCFLAAFGLYDRWRRSGRWPAYWGALLAFVLALLSKEVAVVLPLILLLRDRVLADREARPSPARAVLRIGPMLVVLGGFLVIRLAVLSDVLLQGSPGPPGEWLPRIRMAVAVASRYAWISLVPYPVSPSQTPPIPTGAGDPRFLLAAAGLVGLLATTIVLGRRRRVILFLGGWYWLTLAPAIALNLTPGSTPIFADRFLYLPSVAVALLAALAIRPWLGEPGELGLAAIRRAPAAVLAALLLAFTTLTLWRNEDWKDDLRLYYRMADTDPDSLLASVNLGLLHLGRFEPQEAAVHFARALQLAPDNARVLVGYGLLRAETGHPEEGLRHALRGLGYEPHEGSLHALVGKIYVIAGDFDRASAHYGQATRLQPHVPVNHFVLAWTLMKAGHLAPAIRAFEQGRVAAAAMQWHHRLVDRLGGELFTIRDPARAARYWRAYAEALRAVEDPGDWTRSELAAATSALERLGGAR
jgi:tetratricopeptide (TPR) repeat protein